MGDADPLEVLSEINLRDLSIALDQPLPDIVKRLVTMGAIKTATQPLTDEEVLLIAASLGRSIRIVRDADAVRAVLSRAQPKPELGREYQLRLRLATGAEVVRTLMTSRRRKVGDSINVPADRDGVSHPGKGHTWRVAAIEDNGSTLVLDYDRPHPGSQSA